MEFDQNVRYFCHIYYLPMYMIYPRTDNTAKCQYYTNYLKNKNLLEFWPIHVYENFGSQLS